MNVNVKFLNLPGKTFLFWWKQCIYNINSGHTFHRIDVTWVCMYIHVSAQTLNQFPVSSFLVCSEINIARSDYTTFFPRRGLSHIYYFPYIFPCPFLTTSNRHFQEPVIPNITIIIYMIAWSTSYNEIRSRPTACALFRNSLLYLRHVRIATRFGAVRDCSLLLKEEG